MPGVVGDIEEVAIGVLKRGNGDSVILAIMNRGNIRKGRGDLEGAQQDYHEAIHLKPDFAEAIMNRG
jgi:hypothetical protein